MFDDIHTSNTNISRFKHFFSFERPTLSWKAIKAWLGTFRKRCLFQLIAFHVLPMHLHCSSYTLDVFLFLNQSDRRYYFLLSLFESISPFWTFSDPKIPKLMKHWSIIMDIEFRLLILWYYSAIHFFLQIVRFCSCPSGRNRS